MAMDRRSGSQVAAGQTYAQWRAVQQQRCSAAPSFAAEQLPGGHHDHTTAAKCAAIFRAVDADRDGLLNCAELQGLAARTGGDLHADEYARCCRCDPPCTL